MGDNGVLEKTGLTIARDLAREKAARFGRHLGVRTDRFKDEAAERVEGVAGQLRELGDRFDRRHEADALARRFERTADYLRYRPTAQVAEDAWRGLRESGALWVIGGLAAGFVVYRVVRNHR
jgi:hypothetical protein